MKKEVLLILLIVLVFTLLIPAVFAYTWNPEAICHNIGHSNDDLGLGGWVGGLDCTDLTIQIKYPGDSSYSSLASDSPPTW